MSSKADPSTDGRAIRGEATRRRIVDAARDVLLERGHAGASTRAVADEAGVRLSLVHYHFGGKHGLLLEVLERENELLLRRQQKLYAAPGPLADKWRAFRWGVREIDGHDLGAITSAYAAVPFEAGKPSCIVAHTVKGKGVSYMEDRLLWHYRAPRGEDLEKALAELEAARP